MYIIIDLMELFWLSLVLLDHRFPSQVLLCLFYPHFSVFRAASKLDLSSHVLVCVGKHRNACPGKVQDQSSESVFLNMYHRKRQI